VSPKPQRKSETTADPTPADVQTLRTIRNVLSAAFQLGAVRHMIPDRTRKADAVERVESVIEDLVRFIEPIKLDYEDEFRVGFINQNSECVTVPIPAGYARKRSGAISRGDRYYNESIRGFTSCTDSHTFLYIEAALVKLVITPDTPK